jgi:uncharacterized protein (TIGR02246 family)
MNGATFRIAAACILAASSGCVRVRVGDQRPVAVTHPQAQRAALALLEHGAAAWNAGDLDAFVSDYTDSATFVTSRGLVAGRDRIRALYAPRFAPGTTRDTLRFEDVVAWPVGAGAIHVVAWYVLERGGRVTSRGPTSLVLRREGGRWRIAHDHSS